MEPFEIPTSMPSSAIDPSDLIGSLDAPGVLFLDLHPMNGGIGITLGSREDPGLNLTCHTDLSTQALQDLSNEFRAMLASINLHGEKNHPYRAIQTLAQRVYQKLFSEDIQKVLQDCAYGYLILRIEPELICFPWELLHDGTQFLGCRFACGRIIPSWQEALPQPVQAHSPSYCLIATNPTQDLPESEKEGASLSRQLSHENQFQVEWLNGHIARELLLSRLAQADILHFSGHATHPDSEMCGWKLADGVLTCENIQTVFQQKRPPRLVFCNACHAAEAAGPEPNGHSAMLETFLRNGCQHFIGTLYRILDHESREFSTLIYSFLLSGKSIGEALRQARLETVSQGRIHDLTWGQYILYGDPAAVFLHPEVSTSEARTGCLVDLRNTTNGHLRPLIQEVHSTLASFPHGESFYLADGVIFCAFHRPSDAVRFALRLVSRLRKNDPLGTGGSSCRVAIHDGELLFFRRTAGEKPYRVEGSPIDLLHDLLRIALPQQIVVSRPVFDNARQILKKRDLDDCTSIAWLNHGAFRIKNREEPVVVCEVGEKGLAPLMPPPDTQAGWRCISPDDIPVLGWRPALEQEIPSLPGWFIEERLGEGGYGEVWRGCHRASGEIRVFKFCFRADRARYLKREARLFRHLQQEVGNHPNIVQIFDVYFDEPPYFISMEDVPGPNLATWANDHLPSLSIETRLEIVASIADVLQVAHDTGIIHRDVKPSNILVCVGVDSSRPVKIKLSDFGIGQYDTLSNLFSESSAGFTETFTPGEIALQAGSRFYMAPELFVNQHASIRSDIYSLGIILYQMILGDLNQPLTVDWHREIQDPILVEDIERCTAGNPQMRYASASELARNLRNYGSRKQNLALLEASRHREKQWKKVLLGTTFTILLLLLLGGALAFGLWRERIALRETQEAKKTAEAELYISSIKLADQAIKEFRYKQAQDFLLQAPPNFRNWEWGYLLFQCHQDLRTLNGHKGDVLSVVYAPDGKDLYSAGLDGTIRRWDADSGSEKQRIESGGERIHSIDITGDGQILVVGKDGDTIEIIDTSRGEIVNRIKHDGMKLRCLDLSSDGKLIAVGCEDASIQLFDLQNSRWITSLKQGADPINQVALSSDSRFLAACGSRDEPCDCMARVWDVSTGAVLQAFQQKGYVESVAFSPDGKLLTVGGMAEAVYVYDWATGKEVTTLKGFERMIRSIIFSPDGKLLAACSNEGIILVWCTETWQEEQILAGHQGGIHSIAFSPDSHTLLSAGEDGTCRYWSVHRADDSPLILHEGSQLQFVAINREETSLAVCGIYDGQFPVLDLARLTKVREYAGHIDELHCGEYSPDGRLFAAAGLGRLVRIWRTDTGELIGQLSRSSSLISALSFSKDGRWLAIGEEGGITRIWDTTNWNEISSWRNGPSEIHDIDWSPDGMKVAVALDSPDVAIWEPFKKQQLMTLTGHKQNVRAAQFSPDGRSLATASEDSDARLWDVETGMMLRTFEGHKIFVLSVFFSPDGKRLFTSSEDSTCKVWDVATGRELITLHGHKGPIHCLAYSAKHRFLISGSNDHSVRIWPAYPWDENKYPENGRASLADSIEGYKQAFQNRFEKNRTWEALGEEKVEIQDPLLEQAIREQVDKSHGPLSKKDLEQVRFLNLEGASINLEGVEGCKNINHVRVSSGEIAGFSHIGMLPSLRFLYFHSRNAKFSLTGSPLDSLLTLNLTDIKEPQLEEIGSLKQLKQLVLNGSQIEDIAPIAHNHNLEHLTMINNQIQNIAPLQFLSRLHYLNMSQNRIMDLSALKGLTGLVTLHLSHNQISETLPLVFLTNLNDINLAWNPVDDLEFALSLKKLHCLNIHDTPAATGCLDQIGKLRQRGVQVITSQ